MNQLVGLELNCPIPPEDCGSCAVPEAAPEVTIGPQGPVGENGLTGAPGANGRDAYTTTVSTMIMPAVNSTASVTVFDNQMFSVGSRAYLQGVGYFRVNELTGTTSITLKNLGSIANLPVGALIGQGIKLSNAGEPGYSVPASAAKRYAIIGVEKAIDTNGGALTFQLGSSGGTGAIQNLVKILDADNIVTLAGSSNFLFKLATGSWRITVRQPGYNTRDFKVYIMEITGTALTFFDRGDATLPDGILQGLENGYGGRVADGDDRQGRATAHATVNVVAQDKYFCIWFRAESYTHATAEPTKSRTLGYASNFDDGSGNDVDELFTVIEIDEV